jgi:predicted aspartyl protease
MMRTRPSARLLAGLIAAAALAGPSMAQDASAPVPLATPAILDQQQAETLGLRDLDERMTVAVNIEGRGPFPFIVDTGAERTVISSELARTLALRPGRLTTVHSMSEVSRIATVVIPGLRVGMRTVADIHALWHALFEGRIVSSEWVAEMVAKLERTAQRARGLAGSPGSSADGKSDRQSVVAA